MPKEATNLGYNIWRLGYQLAMINVVPQVFDQVGVRVICDHRLGGTFKSTNKTRKAGSGAKL